jgi:predicted TIM-barrel fold metal-dependent hydrolase
LHTIEIEVDTMPKIDVFNHYFPPKFFDKLQELVPAAIIKRWSKFPPLIDLDARLRQVDAFDEYCQIISLSQPPIDELAGPDASPAIARIANDGMAEVCRKYPDRFPSFLAGLPMNNPDAAVKEIDRAIRELGAAGIQLHSNVAGKPLDAPAFFPVFARMAELGKAVWLHPARGPNFPDYAAEKRSRFEIWWLFGWDYEVTAAMSRLVFSGMFEKLPTLKVIAHHMGGYVPQAEGRISPHMENLHLRVVAEEDQKVLAILKKRPIEYFRMFYADTALFGAKAATRCGLEFFGADKCLFASDSPFDAEGGNQVIRDTIKALDELEMSTADRAKIYEGNAKRLVGAN